MKLYVKDHAAGRLHEVLIDQPDYDALLTLGYPDASHWFTPPCGRVMLECPYTGNEVRVARLVHSVSRCMAVRMKDGNQRNLQRANIGLVRGPRHGATQKARKSLRLAWAALEQRLAAAA